MAVNEQATTLVSYAVSRKLIEPGDARWAYNAILEAVGATGPAPVPAEAASGAASQSTPPAGSFDLQAHLDSLVAVARTNGIATAQGDGTRLATHLMGLLTPRPSEVAHRFHELLARDPQAATDYFHHLSCDVDYIRVAAITRDIKWVSPTEWGPLEMTINLSKPEKDPRAIAAAAKAPSVDAETRYPACQLCRENEGYAGRDADDPNGPHPARQNLRIVPLDLSGQPWGLQYSPYAYYSEHCIVMNDEHVPMHIDHPCFEHLLDFVDLMPQYFVGSNADLPIVGGSILSHDHFQGGRHEFPMDRVGVVRPIALAGHAGVKAGIIRWPVTVLRLESPDRCDLVAAADDVLAAWRDYSDAAVGIVAASDGMRHNTITPIAHKTETGYSLDLALRCNVTSPDHPLGVFHPHEELHHIKKENIGLIEVMGLAILPPRLAREFAALGRRLTAGLDLQADPLTAPHAAWAYDVLRRHPELDESNVRHILHEETGLVFARVLEQAGVFKWDTEGRAALERFLATLEVSENA